MARNPNWAIARLRALAAEARTVRSSGQIERIRSQVVAIVASCLGSAHPIVDVVRQLEINHLQYVVALRTTGSPTDRLIGYIDAAIAEIKEETSGGEWVSEVASFDPELWEEVERNIENGEWGKIPRAVVLLVEDRYRQWAGEPKELRGGHLVGSDLFNRVLADGSPLHLGGQASERAGWRFLAMGLAQAVGNVERHHLRSRPDAKRYAIAVMGLGSLLLTQMKYEHPEIAN